MLSEQRIRSYLFYLSVAIFFVGLPFILSSALGYKFNPRTFKFTKSGLIVIKTQPPGADIYLENMLLNEKTPHTINELLPGSYNIRLELERHYPWFNQVAVEAGKVTRLDKIILFPLRANIKQLNKENLSYLWTDEEKETFYYVNPQDSGIYKSDLQEGHSLKVGSFIKILPPPVKWVLSSDRERLIYFNSHQVAVVYLKPQKEMPYRPGFVLNYPDRKIIDIFWHSDGYHFILITNKDIEVAEASSNSTAVNLVNLNKKNTSAFYDINTDTLYFLDSQKAEDGKFYDNLYRIELNTKLYPLKELIRLKPNE